MSFGLGVASSPSWNPDTNFAFLFSALRLVRLARDVNSVEPSPLEWISVSITCQSWYRCSAVAPHLKVKCKLHNAKSKDPIHSYFLSDTSKKWWPTKQRERQRRWFWGLWGDVEVRLHRHLLPLKRQQPCFALSCSWGRTHQLLEELGVRQRICLKKSAIEVFE